MYEQDESNGGLKGCGEPCRVPYYSDDGGWSIGGTTVLSIYEKNQSSKISFYCPFKGTVQRQLTGVESDRYQSVENLSCRVGHFSFCHFKGTPSREEHKTLTSVYTTIESASTGWIGLIRSVYCKLRSVSSIKLKLYDGWQYLPQFSWDSSFKNNFVPTTTPCSKRLKTLFNSCWHTEESSPITQKVHYFRKYWTQRGTFKPHKTHSNIQFCPQKDCTGRYGTYWERRKTPFLTPIYREIR